MSVYFTEIEPIAKPKCEKTRYLPFFFYYLFYSSTMFKIFILIHCELHLTSQIFSPLLLLPAINTNYNDLEPPPLKHIHLIQQAKEKSNFGKKKLLTQTIIFGVQSFNNRQDLKISLCPFFSIKLHCRNLSIGLSSILVKNEKVKHYIKIKIYKFIVLQF